MELKDFTEKEQEMIKKGLTTSKISDKETAEKILALVPCLLKRLQYYLPLSLKESSYSFALNLSSAISCFTRSQIFILLTNICTWSGIK